MLAHTATEERTELQPLDSLSLFPSSIPRQHRRFEPEARIPQLHHSALESPIGFWQELEQNLLASGALCDAAARAVSRPRVTSAVEPVSIAELLALVSETDSGRRTIAALLTDTTAFQFLCDPGIKIGQRLRSDVPAPIEMCGPQRPWAQLAQRLTGIAPELVMHWMASAICTDSREARDLSDSLRSGAASTAVSIGTYNVWGTHGVLGLEKVFGFASRDPKRFEGIGRELRASDLDIVCLQEMWAAETEFVISGSRYPFVARASGGTGMWRRSGLVTLSRLPIIESEFTPFAVQCGHERFVRKGVLRTRIELADGSALDVFNTHLVSPPEHLPLIGNSERLNKLLRDPSVVKTRMSQLESLGQLAAKNSGTARKIVLGDFNTSEHSLEYQRAAQMLGTDLFRERLPRIPQGSPTERQHCEGITYDVTTNPWMKGKKESPERLDYIFLNPELAGRTAASTRLMFNDTGKIFSDHFGVRADLFIIGERNESAIRPERRWEWSRFAGAGDSAAA